MEESAIPPLLGLIGHKIAGNPTQFAIERILAAANLEWRFLSFDVVPERLEEAVKGLDALGFRGLAVAPSYSAQMFQLITGRARSSELSQWIDIVVRGSDGQMMGHNVIAEALSDWLQLPSSTAESIEIEDRADHKQFIDESNRQEEGNEVTGVATENASRTELLEQTAIILGNTGKTQALARFLIQCGFSKVLFRDWMPPREQPAFMQCSLRDGELAEASLLIRATGADENPTVAEISEAELNQLSEKCAVVDLGTNAGTSPMLRLTSSRGLRTLSSIDLMVMRASQAFQLWTGVDADTGLLREAFEEYLEI